MATKISPHDQENSVLRQSEAETSETHDQQEVPQNSTVSQKNHEPIARVGWMATAFIRCMGAPVKIARSIWTGIRPAAAPRLQFSGWPLIAVGGLVSLAFIFGVWSFYRLGTSRTSPPGPSGGPTAESNSAGGGSDQAGGTLPSPQRGPTSKGHGDSSSPVPLQMASWQPAEPSQTDGARTDDPAFPGASSPQQTLALGHSSNPLRQPGDPLRSWAGPPSNPVSNQPSFSGPTPPTPAFAGSPQPSSPYGTGQVTTEPVRPSEISGAPWAVRSNAGQYSGGIEDPFTSPGSRGGPSPGETEVSGSELSHQIGSPASNPALTPEEDPANRAPQGLAPIPRPLPSEPPPGTSTSQSPTRESNFSSWDLPPGLFPVEQPPPLASSENSPAGSTPFSRGTALSEGTTAPQPSGNLGGSGRRVENLEAPPPTLALGSEPNVFPSDSRREHSPEARPGERNSLSGSVRPGSPAASQMGGLGRSPTSVGLPSAEAAASQPSGQGPASPPGQQFPADPEEGQHPGPSATASPPNRPESASLDGTGLPGDSRLHGPQSPRLNVEKIAPEELLVGKSAVVYIRVTNSGDLPAHRLEIRDSVPRGTRLIATRPQASVMPDGRLVWRIGTLPPGQEVSVEMEILPLQEGDVGSVAEISFAAEAGARSRVTKPELELRVLAPESVLIGSPANLTLRISNPGSGPASQIVVEAYLPRGLSHPAGSAIMYEVGPLAAGESRELTLSLQTQEAGKHLCRLVAHGEPNLRVATEVPLEVTSPQLELVISGSRRRFLDRQGIFELAVTNRGTAPARDVRLTVTVPPGVEFVSANNEGMFDGATRRLRWQLEELPQGETGTVRFVLLPRQAGKFQLEALAEAEKCTPAQSSLAIEVEGIAALQFDVRDLTDPVALGGETIYEIRLANQGSKEAKGVRVTVTTPPGLRPTQAEGPVRYMTEAGRIAFDPLSDLPPKAEVVFRIQAQALRPGDQRIRVEVTSEELRTPIVKEESTNVFAED